MKAFITKIVMYSILVLIVMYAFPLSLYIISKDYMPIEDVVESQLKHKDSLIGFSYFGGQEVKYKMLLQKKIKPNILVFGSSRTFQMRKEFFNKPDEFLNIAVPRPSIGNIVNVTHFIEALPKDNQKRTLILLLDKRFFTESYETGSDKNGDSFFLKFIHLVGKPLRLVYVDYLVGKYSFIDLVRQSRSTSNIGLWALIKDSGYRVDGSYKEGYEMSLSTRVDTLQKDITNRVIEIQNYSSVLLEKEKKIIPKNLEGLKIVLDLCKERNIQVVAFIPPDPIEVAQEISKNVSPYAQAQTTLVADLKTIFSNYGFGFFDASDITVYKGRNEEFIDLIHGGDLVYAKALLYMTRHDTTLQKVVSMRGLEKMIQKATGDFLSF